MERFQKARVMLIAEVRARSVQKARRALRQSIAMKGFRVIGMRRHVWFVRWEIAMVMVFSMMLMRALEVRWRRLLMRLAALRRRLSLLVIAYLISGVWTILAALIVQRLPLQQTLIMMVLRMSRSFSRARIRLRMILMVMVGMMVLNWIRVLTQLILRASRLLCL